MRDQEAQLMARCRRDDQSAWAELYSAYGPTVARFVVRSGPPADEVDDLVQKVFIEFYTSMHRFRGDSSISTWLYRIASRVVSNARRTQSRRRRRHDAFKTETEGWAGGGSESGPAAQLDARGQLKRLQESLATLSTPLRLVWVLVELEGLSPSEAAEVLRIRSATARSRLRKARVAVRKHMERHQSTPADTRRHEVVSFGRKFNARGN